MVRVAQARDLPVFVHQGGEPERAGTPVGPRMDMAQARRPFLLIEVRWKVAE